MYIYDLPIFKHRKAVPEPAQTKAPSHRHSECELEVWICSIFSEAPSSDDEG